MKTSQSKVLRKVLAVSLAAAMLTGTGFSTVGQFIGTDIVVSAATDEETDFNYSTLTDGTLAITGYKGNKTRISIPSSINGKTVARIEGRAFYNNSTIISVSIPNTIKSIGYGDQGYGSSYRYGAFQGCTSLLSITIPDSVETIEKNAFYGCSGLLKLNIGSGLKSIADHAFGSCNALTSIKIPGNVKTIGTYAFASCKSIYELTLCDGINTMQGGAFASCNSLKEVTVPDSLTEFGSSVFENCTSLETINIGSGIEDIPNDIFSGCHSLKNINVSANNPNYLSDDGVLFDKDKMILMLYPIGNERAEYTVPNDVVLIYQGSFSTCLGNDNKLSLRRVIFADSVTTIGDNVFKGIDTIDSIVLGNGIKSIGTYAFYGCKSLKDIYYVNDYKQWKDISINSQYYYSSENYWGSAKKHYNYLLPGRTKTGKCGENVTYKLDGYGNLTISGSGKMYDYSSNSETPWYDNDNSCINIKNLVVTDGVTSIGDNAFYNCDSISSLEIASSVQTIGSHAFYGCTGIKNLTLPEGVIKISGAAFAGCEKLQEVSLPSTLQIINGYAFAMNSNSNCPITNFVVPDGVTTIGEYAFQNLANMKSITIPNSVKTIGNYIFSGCTALQYVYGTTNSTAHNYVKNNNQIKFIDNDQLQNQTTISAAEIDIGEQVDIDSAAQGGTGTYKYAVYYKKSGDSSWTNLQPYSNDSKITFKPDYPTTYDIRTKVKDTNGTEVNKDFTLKVAPTLANNSTVSAETVSFGNPVKLQAVANGGTGTYQYAFFYKTASDTNWKTLQNFSANSSVDLTLTSKGTYDVCIKVRDTSEIVLNKYFTVTVTDSTLEEMSSISAEEISYGNTVTMTAKGNGGTGTYQYSFLYKKSSASSWTTLSAFGEKSTFDFIPAAIGTYDICVKVKDTAGTTVKNYFTLTVTNSTLENSSSISSESIAFGETLVLNGIATGGVGDYSYAYYYKKSTSKNWTTIKSFSAVNSVQFKPSLVGQYSICIKTKDKSGTVQNQYFTVEVQSTLENHSCVIKDSIILGESVNLMGVADEGSGSYQYAYYYKKTSVTNWTTLKGFSNSASMDFKPTVIGDYDLCIKVKDTSGTVEKSYFKLNVTKSTIANISSISSEEINKGERVLIDGVVSGGLGKYQYAFYQKKSDASSWTELQKFGDNSSVVFVPNDAAVYNVCVKIKDESGTVAKKYFTLTVKPSPTYNVSVKYVLEQLSIASYLSQPLNECTYTIDDKTIANVASSEESTIEGLKIGTTKMYVYDNSVVRTFNITVIPNDLPPLVTPSSKMLKLKVGETGTFNCKPQNGISSTVTYSTYNSSICTITQQGVVTAKAVGYGTVAARLSDGQIITCTVEVTN